MRHWNTVEKAIDFIAESMGRVGWVLILYCTIFGVTDVFLRYVLNSPSLWIINNFAIRYGVIGMRGWNLFLKRQCIC